MAVLQATSSLLTRSWRAGAMVTTLALLLLVSRDPAVAILAFTSESVGYQAAFAVFASLVVVVATAIWLGIVYVRRRSFAIGRWTRVLNILTAALVAVVVAQALVQAPRWLRVTEPVTVDVPTDPQPPDIYVILLDAYARADELRTQLGFDNQPFIGQLERRGFYVDPVSRSNYTKTSLTLPSLLNMEYVTSAESASFSVTELRQELDSSQRRGRGVTGLRQAGYELVAVASGWEHVPLRSGMDRTLEQPELTDLERSLLWITWIPDLPVVPPSLLFEQLHSRVEGILSDVKRLAQEHREQPLFAIVHVPAPHHPLAFDEDGEAPPFPSRRFAASDAEGYRLTESQYREAYAANMRALNSRVISTIDVIRARSEIPPVIVLFSDHGYDGAPDKFPSNLHNFLAAYTPGQPALLRGSTPVNMLRILLSAYTDIDVGEVIGDRYFVASIRDQVTTITETFFPE